MKRKRPTLHSFVHKMTALLLILSLLVQPLRAVTLGSFLTLDWLELSDTARLVRGKLYNSAVNGGRQSENLVEYHPSPGLRPIVAYGSSLYGRSDLDYVANWLKEQGMTPAAGLNGSFFSMATGIPIGCIITQGVVRVSGNSNAVGFRDDGSAVIGKPGLDIRVTCPDGTVVPLNYNNEMNMPSGLILYSRDYDSRTNAAIETYNVSLAPDMAELRPGTTIQARVTGTTEGSSCQIPEGGMLLSIASDSPYEAALATMKALKTGDVLQIATSIDPTWAEVRYACGGDELLVVNGAAQSGFRLDSAKDRAARSAVGIKADGTLVFYTVDGRQSGHSAGVTLEELAVRMAEQGCVTALNLDGGGSTTFAARRPGESVLETLNRPSDGAQRRCANFIFLARETVPAGEAVRLHLYPYDAAIPSGARVPLTVKATDAAWQAVSPPAGIQYSAEGGTIGEDGVFTAGAAGTATIRAQAANGASGARQLRVVESPSTIGIQNEQGQTVVSLNCAPGQTVDLRATAAYLGYLLTAQDDCFTWSVTGGIGEIDRNGRFTATSSRSAVSGSIVCSAGSASSTLSVQVSALAPEGGAAYGFEPGETAAEAGEGLALQMVQDGTHVRYGRSSLRVQYDLGQLEAAGGIRQARALLTVPVSEDVDSAGLWVYGDGSNNSLSLLLAGGPEHPGFKWLGQLDFLGWRYLTAPLPEGTTAVTGFAVTEYEAEVAQTGTVWLDQLILSAGTLEDTTPPSLTAEVKDGVLAVSASDGGSGLGTVRATLDGEPVSLDLSNGTAGLILPTDGLAHQVRIEAGDRCGNLCAKTVEISGELAGPFSDMQGHWARNYVSYCAREQIMQGAPDGKGGLAYRPDASMTRQEFAVALVRFLGVDASAYASVALPYTDAAEIAPWALDAMKATYALGYLTGSDIEGVRYGLPQTAISRQQAVTILGRTQEKGWAEADLSVFSDHGQLSSWAVSYAASMAGQGILSGSHGKLAPTAPLTRAQVAKILYFLY